MLPSGPVIINIPVFQPDGGMTKVRKSCPRPALPATRSGTHRPLQPDGGMTKEREERLRAAAAEAIDADEQKEMDFWQARKGKLGGRRRRP